MLLLQNLMSYLVTMLSLEAVLWRAPGASDSADVDDDLGNSSTPLRNVATLEDPGVNEPCRVLWKPQEGSGGAEHVGTLGRHVRIYDVAADGAPRESCSFAISEATPAFGGAWDPHHGSTVSVTHDCSASGWDMRSQKLAYSIATAHKYAARGIDYNPNKPLCVVTSGDDRLVKCWDLRNTRAPVRTLAGHSHWCWTVKYNRFHDQLLLSAGSDSIVNLWRCSSISSAPLLELDGDPNQAEADDCKVRTFTDHEESVYSAAWSACDAWVWASLDYSGRVVINHVPSTEKYKILL